MRYLLFLVNLCKLFFSHQFRNISQWRNPTCITNFKIFIMLSSIFRYIQWADSLYKNHSWWLSNAPYSWNISELHWLRRTLSVIWQLLFFTWMSEYSRVSHGSSKISQDFKIISNTKKWTSVWIKQKMNWSKN